jgi:hypothetical protein
VLLAWQPSAQPICRHISIQNSDANATENTFTIGSDHPKSWLRMAGPKSRRSGKILPEKHDAIRNRYCRFAEMVATLARVKLSITIETRIDRIRMRNIVQQPVQQDPNTKADAR